MKKTAIIISFSLRRYLIPNQLLSRPLNNMEPGPDVFVPDPCPTVSSNDNMINISTQAAKHKHCKQIDTSRQPSPGERKQRRGAENPYLCQGLSADFFSSWLRIRTQSEIELHTYFGAKTLCLCIYSVHSSRWRVLKRSHFLQNWKPFSDFFSEFLSFFGFFFSLNYLPSWEVL